MAGPQGDNDRKWSRVILKLSGEAFAGDTIDLGVHTGLQRRTDRLGDGARHELAV